MRRIIIWAMSTLTVLVLLFSYSTSRDSTALATAETRSVTSSSKESTGSTSDSSGDTATQEPADGSTSTGDSSGSTDSSGSADSSGTSGSSSDQSATTYDGDAYGTRYGDVQVQITVANGRITEVNVLQVPWQDRHDQMINSQAVPIYNSEAVEAQSADIDVVSGATVTWEGYTQSLQSAIDKANL